MYRDFVLSLSLTLLAAGSLSGVANGEVAMLSPVAAGTGEDAGANGSFDSLLAPGFDLQTFNQFGSVTGERRFAIEFDLSAIPEGVTVESANLFANWTAGAVEDPTTLIYGYEGNGAVSFDDMTQTTSLVGSDFGFNDLDIDITFFMQALVSTSTPFAGFLGLSPNANQGIRYDIESPVLTVNYVPEPDSVLAGWVVVFLLGIARLVRGATV